MPARTDHAVGSTRLETDPIAATDANAWPRSDHASSEAFPVTPLLPYKPPVNRTAALSPSLSASPDVLGRTDT